MKLLDLTNHTYGMLTVLYETTKRYDRMWVCKCRCGVEIAIGQHALRSGNSRSCGCQIRNRASLKNTKDLTGLVFGRLTVLKKTEFKKQRAIIWLCRCKCGTICEKVGTYLRAGRSKSCGCYQRDEVAKRSKGNKTRLRHGLWGTPTYWKIKGAEKRAAKLKRTPSWADKGSIDEFYRNCPPGYTVDHIVPLQGKLVSGLHILGNLQYLTQFDNFSKHNKFEPVIIPASER